MYPEKLTPETISDAGVRARIEIERKIVTRLIDDLLAAGCELRVYDESEYEPWTRIRAEVIDDVMNADEDVLHVRRASDGLSGWVHLVYGNEGWDVVSDYTTNVMALLAGVNAYAENLEG